MILYFPYSNWKQRFILQISVSSSNKLKCKPEKTTYYNTFHTALFASKQKIKKVGNSPILTGKNYVLLQEFIEIEAWLLLTFFICLNNQLSSIHSIIAYSRVQMLVWGDSSSKQKTNGCSFQQVLRQILSFQNLK